MTHREQVIVGNINVADFRDQTDAILYLARNLFQNSPAISESLLGAGEFMMAVWKAITAEDPSLDETIGVVFVDKELVVIPAKEEGRNKYTHRQFVEACQSYKRLIKDCPWPSLLGQISKDVDE